MMCLIILEHLKSINFPFRTKGKLMVLDVPILEHFRVFILDLYLTDTLKSYCTVFQDTLKSLEVIVFFFLP